MASCLATINGALRKIGVLAAGREARTVDRDDAFESLKGMYRAWINTGTFGRLRDVIPLTDYTAYGNERIFRNQSSTLAITLPETVQNPVYWTDRWIYGSYPLYAGVNDQTTPRDCSIVVINDAFTGDTYDFIYDGHQKLWIGLYALELTDEAPLSFRDKDGLEACLAAQLADQFSGNVGPFTVRQAQVFQGALTTRFSMPAVEVCGIYM